MTTACCCCIHVQHDVWSPSWQYACSINVTEAELCLGDLLMICILQAHAHVHDTPDNIVNI